MLTPKKILTKIYQILKTDQHHREFPLQAPVPTWKYRLHSQLSRSVDMRLSILRNWSTSGSGRPRRRGVLNLPWTMQREASQMGKAAQLTTALTWLHSPGRDSSRKRMTEQGSTSQGAGSTWERGGETDPCDTDGERQLSL